MRPSNSVRFSEHFHVQPEHSDDWFDPILTLDTPLFVDPLLLLRESNTASDNLLRGAHDDVLDFTAAVHSLIEEARHDEAESHQLGALGKQAEQAIRLLRLPDPKETCLGFTGSGTEGTPLGPPLAEDTALAIWDTQNTWDQSNGQGSGQPSQLPHLEAISLLELGLGADFISDITVSLLRGRLATYTLDVCRRHDIPVRKSYFEHGHFDPTSRSWQPRTFQLPWNPFNRHPVLLVPKDLLRDQPRINPADFSAWVHEHEAHTLETFFAPRTVPAKLTKPETIDLIHFQPTLLRRYVAHVEAASNSTRPYDLQRDPAGVYGWYEATGRYLQTHPVDLRRPALAVVLSRLHEHFRRFIEDDGGHRLLWNPGKQRPHSEQVSRRVYLGLVRHACAAQGMTIHNEAKLGSGIVDFDFSPGALPAELDRGLLLAKHARNTRFWSGLSRKPVPKAWLREVQHGTFVVMLFNDKDLARLPWITDQVQQLAWQLPYDIEIVPIDGRGSTPAACAESATVH